MLADKKNLISAEIPLSLEVKRVQIVTMTNLPLRLGLTLWSHAGWQGRFYPSGSSAADRLAHYATVFHTVEGNTTFYASPSPQTVNNWRAATHDHFRFTFKLPKSITHQHQLVGCQGELKQFLQLMAPLHQRIGLWTIQLPASFSAVHFGHLQKFCRYFPKDFPLAVEVRHRDYFAKGEEERRFNQWLIEQGINRIIMDSRPVFAAEPSNETIIDAQKKKPKVPVHALATADNPMIRFIGHPDLTANYAFFKPWLQKLPQWIAAGKQPYLMIHTPDNFYAPELAVDLYQQLQTRLRHALLNESAANQTVLPDLTAFPAQNSQQMSIF